MKITDAEHEEGQVKGKEEGEECNGRAERANEQERCENEPTHQIQAKRVEESSLADFGETGLDGETTGGEDDGEGQPETSVG